MYIFYVIKTRVSKKDNNLLSDDNFIMNNNLELKDKIIYTESATLVSALLNFSYLEFFLRVK